MATVRAMIGFGLFGIMVLGRSPVAAQDTSCFNRILPIWVEDAGGRPLQGFAPKDFEAKVGGMSAKVLSLVPDERPHRIVILLDASASMQEQWVRAVALAIGFARGQLQNTRLALLVFNEKTEEKVDFLGGQSALLEKLKILEGNRNYPKGKTAIFDSMQEALNVLDAPSSADSLYLISDGGDSASRTTWRQVVERLSLYGVRVFVSLVPGSYGYRGRTPEELNGPSLLGDIVRKSGGETVVPFERGIPRGTKDTNQFVEQMDLFHRKMIYNSLLELELAERLTKMRSLELKLSNGKRADMKDAHIIYPTQLAPCAD